ncbi:MATE family efflux transporter, partial [Desulfococcaceae bacterium OttesenSCG-928-F15]|nr:MATE family efflux transporter [Desulfococcaceae bacterium OttesenSCG-928-F15]
MEKQISGESRIFFGEALRLLQLSFPVWVGQLAFTLAGFADTVMAGRVGSHDLAGVGLAAGSWFPLFYGVNGLLLAVSPICSQLMGAGKKHEIPDVIHHGLLIALIAGILTILVLQCIPSVLLFMGSPENVVAIAALYLKGLAPGIPAMAGYLVFRCFTEAMGDTRPQMLISLLGLPLNVFLNYVFIYGKMGMPAMGGAGCGLATGITFSCLFVIMFMYLSRARAYRSLGWIRRPDFRLERIFEIVRIGLPISLTLFMEISIFGFIVLFIGGLGAVVVSGHQVALNFSGLVYSIPLSLATGTTVRVGQAVGRKSKRKAMQVIRSGMGLSVGIASITLMLTLVFREKIVIFYTSDPEVRALAASLLIFGALYQLSDAVMTASLGALRGFKDTDVP